MDYKLNTVAELTPLELSRWTQRMLASHIGSGDNAHALADDEHAGFMSPWNIKQVNASFGSRIWAGNGADLLTLDPGHYETNNPVNGPTAVNGFCEVDITVSEAGMREIRLLQDGNGKVWYLTLDTGSKNIAPYSPRNWTYLARMSVLWQGNISQLGQTITLNDDVKNYDWLHITARDNQNNYFPIKVYPQAGWFGIAGPSPSVDVTNPSTAVLRTILSQNGNVLKIDKMFRYNSASTGGWVNDSGDVGLQIINVIGER